MRGDDTRADRERVTLDAVERDDRALDALAGLGDPADARTDDPTLRLLAAWHADLSADDPVPAYDVEEPATVRAAAPDISRTRRRTAGSVEPDRTRPGKRRGRRRGSRLALATGVAVLATTGFAGVAMAAGGATPGSPLFSLTKVIYPDRASVREHQAAAAHDLASARKAAAEGRDDDARRYLDDADRHSREMPSSDADAVRRDADDVRRSLGPSPSTDAAGGNDNIAPPSSGQPSPSTEPGSPSPSGGASEQPPPSPSPSGESATTNGDDGNGSQDGNGGQGKGHKKHESLSLGALTALLPVR